MCTTCEENLYFPDTVQGPQGPQGPAGTNGLNGTSVISVDNSINSTYSTAPFSIFNYQIAAGGAIAEDTYRFNTLFAIESNYEVSLDLQINLGSLFGEILFPVNTKSVYTEVELSIINNTTISLILKMKGINSIGITNTDILLYNTTLSVLDMTTTPLSIDFMGKVSVAGSISRIYSSILKHIK